MYLYVAVAGLALLYYLIRRGKKRLDFPGPPPWPLLGNIPQMGWTTGHQTLTRWAEEYGPVYKIDMMGIQTLVISGKEYFHECLVSRPADFSGRMASPTIHEISGHGKDIVFSDPSPMWKRMRKMVHSNIKTYDVGLEKIEQVSIEVSNRLDHSIAEHQGEPLDVRDHIYLATVNILASFLVGRYYTSDSVFFRKFLAHSAALEAVTNQRAVSGILHVFPFITAVYNPVKRYTDAYNRVNADIFAFLRDEAKLSESEGYEASLVSVLEREVRAGDFPEENFLPLVADVIIAGTLTTSNTLYSFVNILIHHPEVQRRAQAQIDDVIGERQVSLSDRERLPYVMATLLELLRYTSTAALGVPHSVLNDTHLAGRHVPSGTRVFFNHFALNHNEALFPEPYCFRPERFLDEEGRLVLADHPNRRNMNAFGAGPRVCLGEALAKGRMFILMVGLMQRFTVESGDEERVSCDPRGYRLNQVLRSPAFKARFLQREA